MLSIPRYMALPDLQAPRAAIVYELIGRGPGEQKATIEVLSSQAADLLAAKLNQDSFDKHVRGRNFTRYVTNWYVTVDAGEAERLSRIDSTDAARIRMSADLQVLHVDGNWMLWSDGCITKRAGELPTGGDISRDAALLISTVRGSDSGVVDLPGGLLALAAIDNIQSKVEIVTGPRRGHYAAERLEVLYVRYVDDSEGSLYVHSAGYFEGYQFDIYANLDKAQAAIFDF